MCSPGSSWYLSGVFNISTSFDSPLSIFFVFEYHFLWPLFQILWNFGLFHIIGVFAYLSQLVVMLSHAYYRNYSIFSSQIRLFHGFGTLFSPKRGHFLHFCSSCLRVRPKCWWNLTTNQIYSSITPRPNFTFLTPFCPRNHQILGWAGCWYFHFSNPYLSHQNFPHTQIANVRRWSHRWEDFPYLLVFWPRCSNFLYSTMAISTHCFYLSFEGSFWCRNH